VSVYTHTHTRERLLESVRAKCPPGPKFKNWWCAVTPKSKRVALKFKKISPGPKIQKVGLQLLQNPKKFIPKFKKLKRKFRLCGGVLNPNSANFDFFFRVSAIRVFKVRVLGLWVRGK
jgi:hypothetical protein